MVHYFLDKLYSQYLNFTFPFSVPFPFNPYLFHIFLISFLPETAIPGGLGWGGVSLFYIPEFILSYRTVHAASVLLLQHGQPGRLSPDTSTTS